MLNLSQNQLISLWCDLEDAYHGQHAYGSDTAEIYAYLFMSANPSVMNFLYSQKKGSFMEDAYREETLKAAESLYNLLKTFMQKRDCRIVVNRRKFGEWVAKEPFEHRVEVQIIRKKR